MHGCASARDSRRLYQVAVVKNADSIKINSGRQHWLYTSSTSLSPNIRIFPTPILKQTAVVFFHRAVHSLVEAGDENQGTGFRSI